MILPLLKFLKLFSFILYNLLGTLAAAIPVALLNPGLGFKRRKRRQVLDENKNNPIDIWNTLHVR